MRKPLHSLTPGAALLCALALASPMQPAFAGSAATPPTCYQLEQACLKHAAKVRAFVSKLSKTTSTGPSETDMADSRCYDAYNSAHATGIWPPYKATPALACTN